MSLPLLSTMTKAGPYMWLPADKDASSTHSFEDDTIRHDAGSGPIELNVQSHAVLAIALMSTRVFSTAARAEHNARSQINEILKDMPNARRALAKLNMPVNEMLMDELQAAHSAGDIVLRTYLTSAAGYRRHLAQGSASDDLKDALLDLHLPHFTWITEISTIDSYNQPSPGMRRIYGHTVMDATSTAERGDGLLVLHIPGLLHHQRPLMADTQGKSRPLRTTDCTSAERSVSSLEPAWLAKSRCRPFPNDCVLPPNTRRSPRPVAAYRNPPSRDGSSSGTTQSRHRHN